ncbi:unnamed protein product, partial [Adineta steineri]
LTDECWTAMICLTGLTEQINGSSYKVWPMNGSIYKFLKQCDSFFRFPTIPFHFADIHFFNEKPYLRQKINEFFLPGYPWYNQQFCDFIEQGLNNFSIGEANEPNTSSSTPTTTSSTSTSATTLVNPCISGGYRWNTTGITILNSTHITHAAHLFFDSNDTLYVVDEYANSVIWKLPKNAVNPILVAGQTLSKGSNSSQLNYPQAVYLDSEQNLHVTDYYNYRVQKYINGSNIGMTIIGINGTAGTASNMLGDPRYLCFDSTETYMYITDADNHRILRFQSNSTSGTNGEIVAGGNGAGNGGTQLNYPWGIHYLSSAIYIFIKESNTMPLGLLSCCALAPAVPVPIMVVPV